MPATYIPLTEVGTVLHVPYYLIKKLVDLPDMLPTPDVRVDGRPGWDRDRIIEFGFDIELLDSDGKRTETKRSWSGPISKDWAGPTHHYLGKKQVGEILHIKPDTVYMRHWLGGFIEPAVFVGRTAGWEKDEILKYAQQLGVPVT